jgi:predicted dehydrogenase
MDKKTIRIGFVGVGGMGQCAHLKNYMTVPDCEVAAIAELKPDLGAKVAARYGIQKVYTDHASMLAKEKLDAIVASQPFTRHGTLVPDLLKSGLPVFTEKPLAGTLPMGEKIAAAVKASGTWMMIGYHKRSDPATMHAKAQIEAIKASGELGPMKYVRLLMPAGDWVAGGFNDLIRADGPAPAMEWDPADPGMDKTSYDQYISFVNYYIHQVNLMRHLLGESYDVTYADPSGVMFAGRSKSGVACVLEMTPFQTTVDWQESALVCFQNGWIKVELPAPLASNRPGKVTIFKDTGKGAPTFTEPQMPWVHAMRQQAMNFVAAVRGERPPMTTADEALEDLKVARQYLKQWKGV